MKASVFALGGLIILSITAANAAPKPAAPDHAGQLGRMFHLGWRLWELPGRLPERSKLQDLQ
jgi:hypothetical protein